MNEEKLHVVIPYFNHTNAGINRRLLEDSIERLGRTDAVAVILAEGIWNREAELPDFTGRVHRHLKYRYPQALWVKENLINLALRDCGEEWQCAVWIDKDIEFLDRDWAFKTREALRDKDIIQPWSRGVCSGHPGRGRNIREYLHFYQGRLMHDDEGMMSWCVNPEEPEGREGHSGFAWAATRAFLEKTGGLYDRCVLGGGDDYLKAALRGDRPALTVHPGSGAGGEDRRLEVGVARFYGDFEGLFSLGCRGARIGFAEGKIVHHYHGPLAARGYLSRYQRAAEHGFDAAGDVSYAVDGTIRLRNESLTREIPGYFRSRLEHLVT